MSSKETLLKADTSINKLSSLHLSERHPPLALEQVAVVRVTGVDQRRRW